MRFSPETSFVCAANKGWESQQAEVKNTFEEDVTDLHNRLNREQYHLQTDEGLKIAAGPQIAGLFSSFYNSLLRCLKAGYIIEPVELQKIKKSTSRRRYTDNSKDQPSNLGKRKSTGSKYQ